MDWQFVPIKQFCEHQRAWDWLNTRGAQSPLLDSRFVTPLLEEFGTNDLVLAICGYPESPYAMAILKRVNGFAWRTFQPSQSPVGLWLHDPSCEFKIVLQDLLKALPGFPVLLGITQQDPDLHLRPLDGKRLQTINYICTPRITVHNTFKDYWAERSKNLRHNMKRQRNRLAREGIKTNLKIISNPADVPAAVAEYGMLESAGWKASQGTALHPNNAQGRFYRRVLEAFAHQGQSRIYQYWYNDKLTATDLCLRSSSNRTHIVLKTTYDESQRSSSPAMLMREEILQQIFDNEDIYTVEFYGRLMDWHTRWSDEIRTMYHINCYRWNLIKRLHSIIKQHNSEFA